MTASAGTRLALGVAASLATPLALAMPTVDGNAIVVPDDGWYQVQDAATYDSLCEGVRRCDVGPGTYLVVNHTTGVRYEAVEVPGPTGGAPTVNGNTISWADDGWYQVQDADTYASFCEGGRSCEVPPGTYRVINLTSGTRYEGITVEADAGPGGDDFPGRITPDLLVPHGADTSSELPSGVTSAGDVNGDGFDDLYVSRFGGGDCGFGSATAVLYGAGDGIAQRGAVGDYPASERTLIADEGAGQCLSSSLARVNGTGDVDGDGRIDLVIDSRFGAGTSALVFGRAERTPIVWVHAFDGQRGATIDVGTVPTLEDVNGDALADMVFEDGRILPGRERGVASIDGPVVRRLPDAFEVRPGGAPPAGTDDYLVEVDGRFAGTFGGGEEPFEVTDTTNGQRARITLRARDADGTVLATTRRTVPAYDGPALGVELVAPRLVRLFVDDLSPPLRSYGRSLIWRDGVPVARASSSGDNWFDTELVLGRTYTYFVTPDYLPAGSLDPSPLANAPLVQRRSNTVTVTLPLP